MIAFIISLILFVSGAAFIAAYTATKFDERFWIFVATIGLQLGVVSLLTSIFSRLTVLGWLVTQTILFVLLIIVIASVHKYKIAIFHFNLASVNSEKQLRFLKMLFSRMQLLAIFGLVTIVVLVASSGIIQYFTPISTPTYGDERMYHASRTIYWLQNQSIFPFTTHNNRQVVFSFGAELFFLWPVLFTDLELVGRMLFWVGYPLSLGGLYFLLRNLRLDQNVSMLGTLVFAATPIVLKYANGLKPELWLTFFIIGTSYWIVQAFEQRDQLHRNLFFVGIFLALSFNVKFTALPLALPILILPWCMGLTEKKWLATRSILIGIVAGVVLSGLIITLSFNFLNYRHILGPAAMRQVHASELTPIQLYTHAIRLPFLLLELPVARPAAIREGFTDIGNVVIHTLGANAPLPLETEASWPGKYTYSMPPQAGKFSLGGLIWLPLLLVGLVGLIRQLFKSYSNFNIAPLHALVLLNIVSLLSIVFLIRWMVDSDVPARFLIATYALSLVISFGLLARFITNNTMIKLVTLLLILFTIYMPLRMLLWQAEAAISPTPKSIMQLSWPFTEVIEYIPDTSRILLAGSQNVPDYPLFAPQLGYANRVISWGKAPFEAENLQKITENNGITHVLIENDKQLDFHWDPSISTEEMVAWLDHHPNFSEIPLTTGQMRLFETTQAKQVRLKEIEQKIQLSQVQNYLKIISVDQSLKEQVGVFILPSRDEKLITETESTKILHLGIGQFEGIQGAVWSKEFQNVLVSIDISTNHGDDSKWIIQLVGLVGGRLVAAEQTFSNSAKLDFPILLKPGRNSFSLIAEREIKLGVPKNADDCCKLINLHKIMMSPIHDQNN